MQGCGSLSLNLEIIWVQILYLARLRSIVEKVRFRSQVETCEGALRLNEEFEIHYLPYIYIYILHHTYVYIYIHTLLFILLSIEILWGL